MKKPGKILTAGAMAFAAMAAVPAEAMKDWEFLSHSNWGTNGALQIAARTEALRSKNAGQKDRAVCITYNFVGRADFNPPNFGTLGRAVANDGNFEKPVGDLIIGSINQICGDASAAQNIPAMEPLRPIVARDFLDNLFPVGLDRKVVLAATLATQISRVTRPGNENYVKCLEANFGVDDKMPNAPAGLKAIFRRVADNKASNPSETLEETILAVMADRQFCGPEPER
jgi:hypothetical protein